MHYNIWCVDPFLLNKYLILNRSIFCAIFRYLIAHENIDLNKRDIWDSVPMYYACLNGHKPVVHYLLESGATCNEFTFDGDRCHYAALNLGIR